MRIVTQVPHEPYWLPKGCSQRGVQVNPAPCNKNSNRNSSGRSLVWADWFAPLCCQVCCLLQCLIGRLPCEAQVSCQRQRSCDGTCRAHTQYETHTKIGASPCNPLTVAQEPSGISCMTRCTWRQLTIQSIQPETLGAASPQRIRMPTVAKSPVT